MRVSDSETQFVDKAGLDHAISELKEYISKIQGGDIDLSNYVTKSELQAKLDALDINIDLSSYATKEELTNAINSIDLSSYATKSEIPSLNGYAKTSEIPSKVSELENDSNYLSSIPEEYVTETELNAKGYLTEHQDLSAYALKTEIPSLDGYATTEYVDNAIANVPSGGGGNVDLSNYYTKAETDALIPSTEGLATTEYVDNAISHIPTTDLSNYYTKDETYSKTEVDTLVANSGGSSGGDNTNIYSTTEEVAIGTWIDGKTIYRKVFEVTISSKTNGTPVITSVEHGIENFYQLVDLRCINNNSSMKTSIGAYGLIPSNLTNLSSWNNIKNYSIRPTVTSSKIMIDAGIQWNNAVITVIIEYTKTA